MAQHLLIGDVLEFADAVGVTPVFLLGLLEPGDRRAAVARELAYTEEYVAMLRATAEALDAAPRKHPFRGTVDLGLRTSTVMQQWLREQAEDD